jgi:hypothetical protein
MRRLSDVARHRTIGALAASATLPSPQASIASGTALFTKAYTAADGSLAGTAAAGAAIVALLPSGAFKTAVSQAEGLVSGAEAGAAVGSIIPGYGTAIGAVVGAVISAISTIVSSSPPNPEGEFRLKSERYCFPAVPLNASAQELPNVAAQIPLQPVCWPDLRAYAVGLQPVLENADGNGDPAPSQTRPVAVEWGAGWVPPPESTATSAAQAWYLAQAWIGGNGVSGAAVARVQPTDPTTASALEDYRVASVQQAITELTSQDVYTSAHKLLSSWYGTEFSPIVDIVNMGVNVNGASWHDSPENESPEAFATWWGTKLAGFESTSACDYVYYPGNYQVMEGTSSNSATLVLAPIDYGYQAWPSMVETRFTALPDTSILGLAELACLASTGVIPTAAADVVAFHYMMGLAWLWTRGQVEDKIPQVMHPNFARVIAIIAAKIQASKPAAPPARVTAATAAQASANAAAEAAPGYQSALAELLNPPATPSFASRVTAPAAPAAPAAAVAWYRTPHAEIGEAVVGLALGAAGLLLWKRRR